MRPPQPRIWLGRAAGIGLRDVFRHYASARVIGLNLLWPTTESKEGSGPGFAVPHEQLISVTTGYRAVSFPAGNQLGVVNRPLYATDMSTLMRNAGIPISFPT